MKLKQLTKGSGLAALAAALAFTALPATASAQDGNRWSNNNNNRASERMERRTENRAARAERRDDNRNARAEREVSRPAPQVNRGAEARPAPPERRAEPRRIEQVRTPPSRAAQVRTQEQPRTNVAQRPAPQAAPRNRGEQFRENSRNRSYADNNRNRSYTDRDRNRDSSRNRDNWRGDRDGYRDGRRDGYRDGRRGDHHRWDRRWRDNNRYNWPYRSWSYRRLNIGFHLDSLFYSNRYWISDPWQYRLPAVYGPYRWVRYYDDVLLVDIYSGEVVDVIYDFFW
jgi:hypothetical protein